MLYYPISASERRSNFKFWIVFIIYLLVLLISECTHEPWGDELQTWNLIKGCQNIGTLLFNVRYDGHPPLWYILLFMFSKISHSLIVIKIVAFLFSASAAFVLLFYSKFNLTLIALILSGYYFLFEYALFSRNYAIVVLIAFLICSVLNGGKKGRTLYYYALLFLLSNSHLLALFLAICFHSYFVWTLSEKREQRKNLFLHLLLGAVLISSGFIYVYSGSDFSSTLSGSLSDWNPGRLVITAQLPLRAFIPVPAWWQYNFWNTNVIWEICKSGVVAKLSAIMVSCITLIIAVVIQSKSNKALFFFGGVFVSFLVLAIIAPMINARYVGFIFIGFLCGLWLTGGESNLKKNTGYLLYLFLAFQIPGSFIALARDWTGSFSQINEVKSIIGRVPAEYSLITDYWALNYLSAMDDKGYFCVESKTVQSFLVLNKRFVEPLFKPYRYTEGTKYYFETNGCKSVYFLTNMSPLALNKIDHEFNIVFDARLVAAKTGSIEKFSNLYLYRISLRS